MKLRKLTAVLLVLLSVVLLFAGCAGINDPDVTSTAPTTESVPVESTAAPTTTAPTDTRTTSPPDDGTILESGSYNYHYDGVNGDPASLCEVLRKES